MKAIVRDFDMNIDMKTKGESVHVGRAFQWVTRNGRWKYAVYKDGTCRIDDSVKFTTKYYEGNKNKARFYRMFEKQWHKDFEKLKEDKIRHWYKMKKLFFQHVDK